MRQANIFIFLIIVCLLSSCAVKQPTVESSKTPDFVTYSVKTIKSIDIASDAVYTILGDLYKSGKITEEQKDDLIGTGVLVSTSLTMAKKSIYGYMWAIQINEDTTVTKDKVINDIIVVAKTFYKLKSEAAIVYKAATGNDIIIPDIFLFDTITDALLVKGE